jgi:hypothetical protein
MNDCLPPSPLWQKTRLGWGEEIKAWLAKDKENVYFLRFALFLSSVNLNV